MTALPRSWPYPALRLCLVLAGCGKSPTSETLMETIDLLLIPAQPRASPTVAEMAALGPDPEGFARLVRFTAPFDVSGHPAITLPAGFTRQGTPVAIQLVAARLQEARLVRAGMAFERVTHWHRGRPSSK